MRERATILRNTRPLFLLALLLSLAPAAPLQAQSSLETFPYTTPRAALLGNPTPRLMGADPYTPSSLSCSINVACSEGDDWAPEIDAVVRISNGCTGVLVNNARQDEAPYVLTVHHCGQPSVGDTLNWTFEFNYQSATCADPAETPTPQTIQGAIVVAAQPGPDDFVLLKLAEGIPASFGVSHAGWSIADETPSSGVVIGHPRQDLKKITLDDDPLTDATSHWVATFDHGTVEVGSSGAPLFNENHQVVGLVRSAITFDDEACSGPGGDDNGATILFPKLAAIWHAGAPGERLADFLDPDGTGTTELSPLPGTGQTLPVEMTSFEAVLDGDAVLLGWQTASETNNAGFEVQRRAGAETLHATSLPWDALGFIEGHGTTERPHTYHYRVDGLAPGRHVFRLKQIDFDGTFAYSPEVEVFVEMAERFVVEAVYPNPFNPQAQFRFAVQRAQPVRVALYDVLGRPVRTLYEGMPQTGHLHTVRIDGSGLPSGAYVVRIVGQTFAHAQIVTLLK